ncbi:MAG: hypothetical protein EPO26_18575 [Chloroflexota bacterium]|nr:MAG: hypothetical protein EPO26_18575 [Chloroflexota bacterium]
MIPLAAHWGVSFHAETGVSDEIDSGARHPGHADGAADPAAGGAGDRRVRAGLSDRDVESLLAEARLGHVSKSAVNGLCRELRARYAAFCARSLAGIDLVVLFLDAIYLPTRPSGDKEGVLGVGLHRGRPAGAVGGATRAARAPRGSARPRARPGAPGPACTAAGGRRRRAGAGEGPAEEL